MGNFQGRISQALPQVRYLPRDESQSDMLSVFKALIKKQLHPKANAQQRLSLRLRPENRNQTGGVKFCFGIPKGAHARENHPISSPDPLRVPGDFRLLAQGAEAGGEGKEISHTIIHNGDHRWPPHRVPLVLGMSWRCF